MNSDKTLEFTGDVDPDIEGDARVFCLVVLSGPDQGAVYTLPEGETIAGRSGDLAQLVLTEPGISRKHAKFSLKDGVVTVEDMGSTNGTYLNGEKTNHGSVAPGDTLGIGGRTSVRLSRQDESISQLFRDLYQDAVLDHSGVLTIKSMMPRLKGSSDHSLAVVELDQVEQIRDRFGHRAEEELVSHVASILKNDLAGNGLVGRLSGEGFLVNAYSRALDADDLLDRVRKTIECSHFRIDTTSGPEFMRVTVSVGLAAFTGGDDFEGTIAAAEKALLMAKQMGRNRVHLSERKKFGK